MSTNLDRDVSPLLIDNVEVVVEEWPSSDQLHSVGLHNRFSLLGLYQGVPQPKRRGGFQLPDKISIFAGPILAQSSNEDEGWRNFCGLSS